MPNDKICLTVLSTSFKYCIPIAKMGLNQRFIVQKSMPVVNVGLYLRQIPSSITKHFPLELNNRKKTMPVFV